MTTRVQVRRQPRRRDWTTAEVLPLDPRDLEVVRAKAMLRATGSPGAAGPRGQRKV